MSPVERIDPPSPEEFLERYVARSKPVILRGAIDHWPAMQRWSTAYFKERFGERRVPVVRSVEGTLFDVRSGLHYETIRVSDYVDRLADARPIDLYMLFRVHEAMPELMDDVIRPAYCRDAGWYRSRFWFASPDTKGPLHRDLPENLYAQIVGHKQFVLLDRRLTQMVHAFPWYSGVPNYSPVDAEAPDLVKYPRFRGAPLSVASLGPGDLLYIPRLWWHQAHSADVSISVNLWWLDGPLTVVAKAAEAFMNVRKLRLLFGCRSRGAV